MIDFYIIIFLWGSSVKFIAMLSSASGVMVPETVFAHLLSPVFLGIVAGTYVFLAKRTLGQRILGLEFYRKDGTKITFCRNAVVHGLLAYPFLTISVIPNIIFSYTKESLWMDG
ncbi:hypothetical protein [Entomospira culicis]|uniref:Uncharacterized protein n=2 Tax=Entomospira culicis TaxID=2719989 RepID=A0A968GGC6_9SPIO|nr:hypothetical protein [Entomospira culicis]